MFEDLADLAATLKAIELLEVGKANRSVSARVHLQECTRLIEQYKQLEAGLLRDGSIASRDDFIKRYNVTARRALQRIDEGIAVPQVNRASPAVEVSLHLLTLLNTLDLHNNSVEVLLPQLVACMGTLGRIEALSRDLHWLRKLHTWQDQLTELSAADVLTAEQLRQLRYDVDNALSYFREWAKQ